MGKSPVNTSLKYTAEANTTAYDYCRNDLVGIKGRTCQLLRNGLYLEKTTVVYDPGP